METSSGQTLHASSWANCSPATVDIPGQFPPILFGTSAWTLCGTIADVAKRAASQGSSPKRSPHTARPLRLFCGRAARSMRTTLSTVGGKLNNNVFKKSLQSKIRTWRISWDSLAPVGIVFKWTILLSRLNDSMGFCC